MSKSEGREGGEEGFAALRLPFGVTMSFAAVGTARFAIAQLLLQNHREHDMVPYGREHFVVAALRFFQYEFYECSELRELFGFTGKMGKDESFGKCGKDGKCGKSGKSVFSFQLSVVRELGDLGIADS